MGFIRVQDLGKAYKHYPRKWGRLAEWLGARTQHQLKWALRGVSFTVAPGEAIGIIGLNGAGKSTLLKMISGTTQPTEGRVEVGGRTSALLELGIGFHPEFTGRENVYMAGHVQGLDRSMLDSLMPRIEEFAGIGDYIDQPVRTYSSGMQVRLAFSVATAVRPDALIVDEALSVGDILFQQQCFDRIREFRDNGTTLLFVSHSMGTVYSLCTRTLLLQHGQLVIDSSPKEAIDLYNALVLQERDGRHKLSVTRTAREVSTPARASEGEPQASSPVPAVAYSDSPAAERDMASVTDSSARRVGSYARPDVAIAKVELLQEGHAVDAFVSETEVTLQVRVRFEAGYEDPHVGFQIRDRRGEPIFMTNTHCMHMAIGHVDQGTELNVRFTFRAALAPGDYSITAGVANGGLLDGHFREALTRDQDVRVFTVLRNLAGILWTGVYNLDPVCTLEKRQTERSDVAAG